MPTCCPSGVPTMSPEVSDRLHDTTKESNVLLQVAGKLSRESLMLLEGTGSGAVKAAKDSYTNNKLVFATEVGVSIGTGVVFGMLSPMKEASTLAKQASTALLIAWGCRTISGLADGSAINAMKNAWTSK